MEYLSIYAYVKQKIFILFITCKNVIFYSALYKLK